MRHFGCLVTIAIEIAMAVACSPESPPPTNCPAQPAFDVVVTAQDRKLPEDLHFRMHHSAGCEVYALESRQTLPCDEQEQGLLFCDVHTADAGSSGGPQTLRCQLWTNGAATVEVESREYPAVKQDLEAVTDECGIKTVGVAIELIVDPDAG